MKTALSRSLFAFALAATVAISGCAHLGPQSVAVDRFEYSTTIADSWKQQTLLNIVKMRYMDLPVFVDVSSIVAGYSMQTGVNVNGVVSSDKAVQGNYVALGGQAIYTDRPTITYVPMTGDKFLRGLLTPIDPKNIFSMLQSGYAADFILSLTVESLNGVGNRSAIGAVVREADPDFLRVLQLLREVQAAGGVGMRLEDGKGKAPLAVLFFRRDDVPSEIAAKAAEIRRLLKLPAERQKFTLVYSPVRGAEDELAVNSRSMMQIMAAASSYLEVPEEHLQDHSAIPSVESPGGGFRIRSGKERPAQAFVAVQYRGYWFWIDEADWSTKRVLTAIVFLFTLGESGGNDKLPLVTIPAQ